MGTFETTTDHQTEVSKFHSSYIKMIENWRSDAYLIYLEFLLKFLDENDNFSIRKKERRNGSIIKIPCMILTF